MTEYKFKSESGQNECSDYHAEEYPKIESKISYNSIKTVCKHCGYERIYEKEKPEEEIKVLL